MSSAYENQTRGGYKNVTRWQKHVIKTVWELKSRQSAAEELDLSIKGLSDLLYRAFLVLGVDTIEEAVTKLGYKKNDTGDTTGDSTV